MSQTMPSNFLPSAMEEKLAQISRRQAVISVLRAVAIGTSVLFATMVVAMLIDWQLTLFSTGFRTTLTVTSLVLSVAAALIAGVPSLAASLKRIQAAVNADAAIPQLEERWQTVVGAANSNRHASSTAKAMLQQVTSEAVAIGRIVQPRHVAGPKSLKTALKALAACTVVLVGFLAIDWPQTSVLLRRFFAPTANISATSLDCLTGDVTIARGEFVDLVAEMKGLRRKSAILTIERTDSKPESVELAVDKKGADRFVHRMQVDETFQYRVRAGDGQTDWHTVTVVDYPELAEVRFTIVAPAYLNRPNVEKTIIPGRLKVMQGSLLQLQMRPKAPLQRLELTIAPDTVSDGQPPAKAQIYALTADDDGWYRFNTQLTENLSIIPQLWNSHGLTNEDRTVCRIQVIADNAPVARVLTPTDEMSVAADDVVDIKFEAHDDHGITKAELVVYDESAVEEGQPAPVLKVLPIPLGDQQLAKHVVGTTQLDLKQLNLKPGTQVSYAVRVTDNRTVANERTTTSPRQTQSTEPASAEADSDRKPSSSDSVADARSKDGTEGQSDELSKASPSDAANRPGDDSAKETAKAAAKSTDSAKAPGKEVASDASGSNPTHEAPDDLAKPRTNPGDNTATDAAKISRTDTEKDSQRVRAKAVGKPSESENEITNNNSSSSDSDKSPLSNPKKGASGSTKKPPMKDATDVAADASDGAAAVSKDQTNKEQKSSKNNAKTQKESPRTGDRTESNTKSTEDNEPQSTDPADRPTGGAPPANPSDPKSQRPGTIKPEPKKDASSPDDVGSPADDDAKPGQPMPTADEGEPRKADPKSGAANPKPDGTKASDNAADDADKEKAKDTDDDTDRKSTEPSDSIDGQAAKRQNQKSNKSEDGPPPPRMIAMVPQQSESGQNAETNRRTLRITERLSAVAEARESRKAETSNVRDRVVEIDGMLAEVETGLTRIVNREIPDDDQSAQYKNLDTQLGKVEGKISALRKETRDEQFAFVGLQMLDIGRSHVTPAREKVFVAIREPVSASSGNSRGALQQIVRARELLAALLKRYDRVARDQQLAEALKDGVKMYEVYVEKMQQLMREARQNQNPLDRKMAVIEVDQDYLDRYAEVLTMRREMLAEFGRILGDDPRLLARYLDLVKRRRSSLRDQLSELAKRQKEAFAELSGWQAADATQREDLWNLAVELRMQASTQLAKDAAELGERIEKQFPLVLEASHQTPAKVIALGQEIAETSREISLEARRQIRQLDATVDLRSKARQLTRMFVDLDAMLEQLSFENSKETEVTTYVTGRLLESRTVADQADLWRQTAEHVHEKRYHGFTEVDQHRIAIATELLRVDLLGIETELSAQFQQLAEKSIPEPIVAQIRELQQLMEDITFEQTGAEFAMSENRLPAAEKLLTRASDNFTQAEELFDRMRRAIADALDEVTVPNPTVAELEDPKLDEFLTQLEREPNIDAQLGIPERPRNLRIIADSLMWQEEGAGKLGTMEEEARVRMKEEQKERKVGKGPADPEKPETEPKETEPKENELTDEERQEQENLGKTRAELAKAIEAQKERAKDPSADAEELKKLEQAAKEAQEKLDEMQQAMDPDKLWKPMKADLEKTLALLKETTKDPSSATVDSQRIEMLTRDLQRLLDQMRKEPSADNRWKMVAEFERKKEILKAVARGERIPDEQWNKLLSKLDDGLWQVGGRSLPEEYRKAIEQYQEQIRKLTNSGREDDR
ncbi:MAG: hypothetical protein AABP62_08500 [Planctomycetota bacterium]